MIAAALVTAVAVVAALFAALGPAAGTELVPANGPIPAAPPAAADVPAALTELWRAPSPATPVPVAEGATVVTGDTDARGGTVLGREPLTGRTRWTYHRDLALCTVGSGWQSAISVFRRGADCADVTKLDPATGNRQRQRNSEVNPQMRLFSVGKLIGAGGANLLEIWRNDLVKTVMYGATRADAQPDRQPHRDCRHLSAAGTEGRLAVLEQCPDEPLDRLSLIRPDGEKTDRPEVEFSVLLPGTGTRLVAVNPDRVAVVLSNPPRVTVWDGKGDETASYPLDVPGADLAGDRTGDVAPTADSPRWTLWWSGTRTVALDIAELRPVWSVRDALGPGTTWSGRVVVPVRAGLAVLDADSGAVLRTVPVDRAGYAGPVALSTVGSVLLEQRGPTVVALH